MNKNIDYSDGVWTLCDDDDINTKLIKEASNMTTKNGTKKKPTARSTTSGGDTSRVVTSRSDTSRDTKKETPVVVEEETEVKTRRSRPAPVPEPEPETNQDSDEPKRKYVGVMSLWCNEKWKEIQETRDLEPDDAGMSSSIRPTEAQILIDELQLGIDEKRNTQMYLMANQYKTKDTHPDFKLSILVDPDYANECYDKIKNSSPGSGGVARSRRSRSGGSTRRFR